MGKYCNLKKIRHNKHTFEEIAIFAIFAIRKSNYEAAFHFGDLGSNSSFQSIIDGYFYNFILDFVLKNEMVMESHQN